MSTIKLPSPPVPMHGFFTALHKGYIVPITDTDLRARDLEVARAVLEAAAKMIQNERLMFSDEEWRIRCELAESLCALEFKHHE